MNKYNVIYADPAWSYNRKTVGSGSKSGAKSKYNVMTLEEIKSLPINEITEESAVLFMWATVPLLPEALTVFPSWGFKYKTMIIWEKTGFLGMGNWLRIQTEVLLIGVKGKDIKPFRHQEKNIYRHPICDHSAKPHFFRELVNKLSKKAVSNPSKLELFARSRAGMFPDYEYEGWDVWGNQVNNSIALKTAI